MSYLWFLTSDYDFRGFSIVILLNLLVTDGFRLQSDHLDFNAVKIIIYNFFYVKVMTF